MRNLDISSLGALFSSLLGLVLVSLVAVGIRLLAMQTLQRKRERENRQLNERLKTLMAAYKTLGSSFTGDLDVDPLHLRDLRAQFGGDPALLAEASSDRRRRIRDAVEAALSDVILLGTATQVELAARAARDLVAGRRVRTHELVVSLRVFIRRALDLDAVPDDLESPEQGPLRGATGGGRQGKGDGAGGGGKGGGGGGGMGGMGGGMGGMGGLHGDVHHDPLDPH